MTEKQKDRRSLIVTVSVLLTFSILFSMFYFVALPLIENALVENLGVGGYISYRAPMTLEEYNEIIARKSKTSLAEVEPSTAKARTDYFWGHHIIMMPQQKILRKYDPQMVIPFTENHDCFIGEFRGENGKDGNYIAIICKPYGDYDSFKRVCQRPANAPTVEQFKALYPSLHHNYSYKERNLLTERFGGTFNIGFGWDIINQTYILLSDGVAVVAIHGGGFSVQEIHSYDSVDKELGIPLTMLIDLFNEHERSEGK